MSRLLSAICGGLLSLALSSTVAASSPQVNEKNTSAVPYRNAMDAMKEQKFDDAISWLGMLGKDFPDSSDNLKASVVGVSIQLARELALLKVANTYRESMRWDLDKKRGKKEQVDILSDYEGRAVKASEELLKDVQAIFELLKKGFDDRVTFDLAVKTEGWEVSPLRDSLKKGEMLDQEEMSKLYFGEFISNYVTFLSEIVPVVGDDILSGNFKGDFNRTKFYRQVGERLLINARRTKGGQFLNAAESCFERVLTLTNDAPYDGERRLAQRGLDEIKTFSPSEEKQMICPKCKNKMEKNWKFCPFDGASLPK